MVHDPWIMLKDGGTRWLRFRHTVSDPDFSESKPPVGGPGAKEQSTGQLTWTGQFKDG